MTVLHDETLTEDQSQMQFDMAAEGWTNHSLVLLTYTPPQNYNGSTAWITVSLGNSADKLHVSLGSGSSVKSEGISSFVNNQSALMLIKPSNVNDALCILNFAGGSLFWGSCAVTNAATPLTFRNLGLHLPAGAQIKAIGIL